jgi:hypothetical protein
MVAATTTATDNNKHPEMKGIVLDKKADKSLHVASDKSIPGVPGQKRAFPQKKFIPAVAVADKKKTGGSDSASAKGKDDSSQAPPPFIPDPEYIRQLEKKWSIDAALAPTKRFRNEARPTTITASPATTVSSPISSSATAPPPSRQNTNSSSSPSRKQDRKLDNSLLSDENIDTTPSSAAV